MIAFMPAAQGVVNWPPEGPNAAALVADDALPLPDASIDRVLAIHSLEMAENARGRSFAKSGGCWRRAGG